MCIRDRFIKMEWWWLFFVFDLNKWLWVGGVEKCALEGDIWMEVWILINWLSSFIVETMYIPQGFNHMYGIPLIMEVGSLNTKIGFAGKERPDLFAPSVSWNWFSTSRSTKTQAKKHNWISIPPSHVKTTTQKASSKTVSSMIGKASKLLPDSPLAKKC